MENRETFFISNKATDAKQRTAYCSFLASGFSETPDREFVERLMDPEVLTSLNLPDKERMHPLIKSGLLMLKEYFLEIRNQPLEEVQKKLAVEWTRLFRGISRGYGPPPPYEGVYRSEDGTGIEIIEEISQIYSENRLRLGHDVFNRPDYIGLEFDFLNHLAETECRYWLENNDEKALGAERNYDSFFCLHIKSWVPNFCILAEKEAQTLFYKGLIKITQGFVDRENQVK